MGLVRLINQYLFPAIEWAIFTFTLHKTLSQGRRKVTAGGLLYFLIACLTVISDCLNLPGTLAQSTFMILLLLLTTHYLYHAPPHIAAFFCIGVYYASVLTDLLLGNLCMSIVTGDIETTLAQDPLFRFGFSLCAKLLQTVLSAGMILGFRRISWNIPNRYWVIMDALLMLYFCLVVAFFTVNAYLQTRVAPAMVTLMILAFLATNVLTVMLFSTISTHYIRSQLEYTYSMTKSRLDNDILTFERKKAALNKTNHDFKSTLSNIALLIQNGAGTEALNYIAGYTASLPEALISKYTGIAGIDSMISLKAAAAEAHDINMTIVAEPLPADTISVVDVATIISNILDNAIEANRDMPREERYIHLACYSHHDILNIIAENPCRKKPLVISNRLITSKADIDSHGYGTTIVREICENHNGHFMIEYSDGKFTAHASLLEVPLST